MPTDEQTPRTRDERRWPDKQYDKLQVSKVTVPAPYRLKYIHDTHPLHSAFPFLPSPSRSMRRPSSSRGTPRVSGTNRSTKSHAATQTSAKP